ncbi:MAG: DUF359 domain-containing protein [Halobacteriales archaeon SW_8_66_22]|nr:MAG: DUF359 domain-containing protein [Halobacteriales archaeon SW_8_66_22]
MSDPVLRLQESLRAELKEPLGPVYTDPAALLADASAPLIAVGDVVTAHLLAAGHTPAVALVDERTERAAVEDWVADAIAGAEGFDQELTVTNPAAVLTESLLLALRVAIAGADADGANTLLTVDGEEDLATLPVILAAPAGATAVYGQPGEGMVRVTVDGATRELAGDLLARMEGDSARLRQLLGVDGRELPK